MKSVFYPVLILWSCLVFSSCSTVSNIVKNEFAEKNPEDILRNTAAEYIVNSGIEGEAGRWIATQMEILKIMLSEQLGDSVMIRQPEEGLLLVFDSDRLFRQGLEYVKDSSVETLQVLASALQRFPNTRLYILVHTDNSSSEFIALSLTDKRAKNIKKILASKSLKRSQIVAEGRGYAVPVISNESPEGRKLNRRVEMAVTANHKMIRQAIKSTKAKR
ncbi:MAG: OmpA family protein [Bacteroidales bacterium]|nr:OmpA family protein [Bacteroidales bacterium]MDD3430830.1 OmpA family protein [Bacteroidales bacterium]MDD4361244.1 OmpA family protein [Bacteroidales bacterium]